MRNIKQKLFKKTLNTQEQEKSMNYKRLLHIIARVQDIGLKESWKKAKYKLHARAQNKLRNISTQKVVKNTPSSICYAELKKIYNAHKALIPHETPLVSMIILNRDGLHHLERLFKSLKEQTRYPHFELIVVDNGSKDGSREYLRKNNYNFQLTVIENQENVSFSKGNNDAVKLAKGDFILLLNNDVEPLSGWLCRLVTTTLSTKSIGSVGAKLIYPYKNDFINSCTIQHAGIAFRDEGNLIRPYNVGTGMDPKDHFQHDVECAALTAACLLIPKERYEEVNGLDEAYFYGYEDVDLGLKLYQKGYKNILCSSSALFHYEFGTQNKDAKKAIQIRRLSNMKVFKNKWGAYLKKTYFEKKLDNAQGKITLKPLVIALAVTDAGKDVPEGDYFTASELAESLIALGWEVRYLRRKYNEWYAIDEEIDIVISLLDAYDVRKIPMRAKRLITIAWARNWFDRWVEHPSFKYYDIVMASSQIACDYIHQHGGKTALLLPIATNINRFNMSSVHTEEKYQCDYCFTGSYWNDKREITSMLQPDKHPEYTFHLYGKNWELDPQFKKYHYGFVSYEEMPVIYASTKIVIDDANRVTKPYGSVNSRVFDAIASGALVLTNGQLGSLALFDGELPYFSTADELYDLLSYYLNNEEARQEKVATLQRMVLEHHTYANRAATLKEALSKALRTTSIAIKVPAPNWDVVQEWGDYHLALALQKEFVQAGYRVVLQVLPEWNSKEAEKFDVALVLRGLSRYTPIVGQLNIMWNISHPDKVTIEEYNEYDYVYIASELWANEIARKCAVPVYPMLQCSDESLFKIPNNEEHAQSHTELLFVGNSRKIFRKIVQDLLPTTHNLAIYGTNWGNFVDKKYIKDEHIPNTELYKFYGSAEILLNDHWDDMREKGFISNRIFDALASGAFLISDAIDAPSLQDYITTYITKDELHTLIEYYLNHPKERLEKASKGRDYVLQHHTFKHRVKEFISTIESLNDPHLPINL